MGDYTLFWGTKQFAVACITKLRECMIEFKLSILESRLQTEYLDSLEENPKKIREYIQIAKIQTNIKEKFIYMQKAYISTKKIIDTDNKNWRKIPTDYEMFGMAARRIEITEIYLLSFPHSYHKETFWAEANKKVDTYKTMHTKFYRTQDYTNIEMFLKDVCDTLEIIDRDFYERIIPFYKLIPLD